MFLFLAAESLLRFHREQRVGLAIAPPRVEGCRERLLLGEFFLVSAAPLLPQMTGLPMATEILAFPAVELALQLQSQHWVRLQILLQPVG